jgi:phosphoenolpyruvate---glycerone phosphotransferase subunit DhaL
MGYVMTNRQIDSAALAEWVSEFSRIIIANKDMLSELDSSLGDADHGSNMERGMIAVSTLLQNGEPLGKPTDFLKGVGMTIVSKVGGSSGALYGTIFLRMARSAGSAEVLDGQGFAKALRAGLEGVVDRGKVKAGDKTMFDALAPAVGALDGALAKGASFEDAIHLALTAAEAGRDATVRMAARKGKSSYLGEKSVGSQDPGATSVTMLIAAAAATLGNGRGAK